MTSRNNRHRYRMAVPYVKAMRCIDFLIIILLASQHHRARPNTGSLNDWYHPLQVSESPTLKSTWPWTRRRLEIGGAGTQSMQTFEARNIEPGHFESKMRAV